MNKIVLGTIDLTDFTDAFQNTYSIVLDNEVRNLTGITEAKVTVEIIGLETRDFTVTNLSCINDTEGYKSTIITEEPDGHAARHEGAARRDTEREYTRRGGSEGLQGVVRNLYGAGQGVCCRI